MIAKALKRHLNKELMETFLPSGVQLPYHKGNRQRVVRMKQEFLKPILRGARFEEHTLPLELAKDFAAYEKLVIDLAKKLYLTDNPTRQRVPKGFGADFHLHIEQIEGGSTKPILAAVFIGALTIGGLQHTYLEKSRDEITACIGAADGAIPNDFPKNLLGYFNRIGRSLKPGESIGFPRGQNIPEAVLTPERRRALVLGAAVQYEEDVEIRGTIQEVDWENERFRVQTREGASVSAPMPKSFKDEAGQIGGKPQHAVQVAGTGVFDNRNQLLKLTIVENIESLRFFEIADRLDDLLKLENGWLDGEGTGFDAEALSDLKSNIIDMYPETLPIPAVVPTVDGGVLLEWKAPGDPSVDFDLAAQTAMIHSFKDDGTDLIQEFKLDDSNSWKELIEQLKAVVGETA